MIGKNEKSGKFISQIGERMRVVIFLPIYSYKYKRQKTSHERSVDSRVKEALGLACAIKLNVIHYEIVNITTPCSSTLFRIGKVNKFAHYISEHHITLAIVDHFLTPVQQRNLEKLWNCKVIDRTALILEIFGDRARTKEGVLQVELAHLSYQKSRLVRSWTHLERQRGGSGFLGGPGETQIEADRRLLQNKIIRIRRELETVVKTRALHRAKRKKIPYPVIALVGYTNAGKSTLFNHLSDSNVLAEDMLFATLDPTLRKIVLPHGQKVLLSDTVGFISNLPTHLIAAFRATLEEVIEADLILHVRDVSDPDHYAHAQDVLKILSSLGVDINDMDHIVEIWNKIDVLDQHALGILQTNSKKLLNPALMMSALTGKGLKQLLALIEKKIFGDMQSVEFILKPNEMRIIDWFYKNSGQIEQKSNDDGSVTVKAVLTAEAKKRLNYIK
ncbi:GTP-binding protein HflX [Bartonella clarridgeiae 73]|uniref:GTPase HflX n=1 Tax=Bartonella clarridgeiae (strain CCUG 45776 / CIP 104772 / 73) TaxID=696125 RepID=E6YI25_BARC7|nr:GTPase HflX [Bartonella clarridgeiae]WCR54914.1 MAG: Ribosome LSU-associated GTP-binding protein HflX [Bartonella clarridgeiae]CBI76513.1 GTP-binding protein HflX [Bartonella clarridgeiae 73]